METGAGRASLAFVLAVVLGRKAVVDIARLHQRLTSIIRFTQISWYIRSSRGMYHGNPF